MISSIFRLQLSGDANHYADNKINSRVSGFTAKLNLKNPRFRLRKDGMRINGSIISPTFKGKGDLRRQDMIWNVLEKAFGPLALKRVGMILAYTPDEWDPFRIPDNELEKATSRK